MLRLIEFGLLGVALLVIIGLIVSGARAGGSHIEPKKSTARDATLPKEHPDTDERGKPL